MIKTRIVVGADGSAGSNAAVRWAAAEARLRHAELRVLIAFHQQRTAGSRPPVDEERAAVVHAAVALARSVAPGLEVRGVARHGYAVPVLLHAAEAAALLVVGDRGAGGLPGRPAGSVGPQLAGQARGSVVVVRGRPGAGTGPFAGDLSGREADHHRATFAAEHETVDAGTDRGAAGAGAASGRTERGAARVDAAIGRPERGGAGAGAAIGRTERGEVGAGAAIGRTERGEVGAGAHRQAAAGGTGPDAARIGADQGLVIAGIDDGPAAATVLGHAFEEAALRGVALLAITTRTGAAPRAGTGAEAVLGRDIDPLLDLWRAKYPEVATRREFVEGLPERVLVERSQDAQLVVVGPRGHRLEQEAMLGPIGRRLLQRAACPVLIAR